ncbi:zinc-binding dehydrogenase [Nocardia sp. R6R-6]|uniref:zinc-binding dehydrogenase n=1 Tax=Nocardia sp. R6R-6 TaxID=3459303 RepID=UPI00403E1F94
MKAITQQRYGSTEALEFGEVDTPVPGDDEVLIRVHAAAVNALDWHVMRGDPYLARPMMGWRGPRVRIRGRDFAGRVAAVGRNVTGLAVDDEVFGEADGAFAEYLTAAENVVARKPAGSTFEQAAAIPLAGNTALMGLRDLGQLEAGQRVLINGASGGVGTFAVQIAKAFGAEVTGVCSTRNAELVRTVGADHIIDYTIADFTCGTERYDLILDLVGNHSMAGLRQVLAPAGKLVLSGGGVYRGGSIVGPMALMIAGMVCARFVHWVDVLQAEPSQANLTALAELAESGKLTPVIDRTYPLSQVAAAINYLEAEHASAKVVITI